MDCCRTKKRETDREREILVRRFDRDGGGRGLGASGTVFPAQSTHTVQRGRIKARHPEI